MGCGKYSPTVSASYANDQEWWEKHKANPEDLYDRDGYDWYGYHHETELDRAGYTEWDYLDSGRWEDDHLPTRYYWYPLYERVAGEWSGKVIGG